MRGYLLFAICHLPLVIYHILVVNFAVVLRVNPLLALRYK